MKTYCSLISIAAITMACALLSQEITPRETHFIKEIAMKNYAVIQKPSIMVIGIECRTSNALDAGPYDIPKHWENFYVNNIIDKIPNRISNEIIHSLILS